MILPRVMVQTDRLLLRTPLESDFETVAAFMASPRTRFVGGQVTDPWQQWRGFLSVLGHWALRGYGFFTVLHGTTPVGRVGIVNHAMWQEPELGWHLFDGFEGQGFATEAAVAVRRWGFSERGLGPLISYINPANDRSRRVALRLGAHHESDGTLLGTPCEVWRHPAPEGTQ